MKKIFCIVACISLIFLMSTLIGGNKIKTSNNLHTEHAYNYKTTWDNHSSIAEEKNILMDGYSTISYESGSNKYLINNEGDSEDIWNDLESSDVPETIEGLQVWLDASKLSAANNQKIGEWSDNKRNISFVQSDSIKQPIFKVNAINNKAALRFNSNMYLEMNDSIKVGTVIVVATKPTGAGVLWGGSYDRTHHYIGVPNVDPTNLWWRLDYGGKGPSISDINAGAHVFYADFGYNLYIDGKLMLSGTKELPITYNKMFIGVRGSLNSYFNGDIAELIIYDRVLSNEDRQKIETYLLDKYSLLTELENNYVEENENRVLAKHNDDGLKLR